MPVKSNFVGNWCIAYDYSPKYGSELYNHYYYIVCNKADRKNNLGITNSSLLAGGGDVLNKKIDTFELNYSMSGPMLFHEIDPITEYGYTDGYPVTIFPPPKDDTSYGIYDAYWYVTEIMWDFWSNCTSADYRAMVFPKNINLTIGSDGLNVSAEWMSDPPVAITPVGEIDPVKLNRGNIWIEQDPDISFGARKSSHFDFIACGIQEGTLTPVQIIHPTSFSANFQFSYDTIKPTAGLNTLWDYSGTYKQQAMHTQIHTLKGISVDISFEGVTTPDLIPDWGSASTSSLGWETMFEYITPSMQLAEVGEYENYIFDIVPIGDIPEDPSEFNRTWVIENGLISRMLQGRNFYRTTDELDIYPIIKGIYVDKASNSLSTPILKSEFTGKYIIGIVNDSTLPVIPEY